jgi:hypothetical protein
MLDSGATTLFTGRYGDLVMGHNPFVVHALTESLRQRHYRQFAGDIRAFALRNRLPMYEVAWASFNLLRGGRTQPLHKPHEPFADDVQGMATKHSLTTTAATRLASLYPRYDAIVKELGPPEKAFMLDTLLSVSRRRRLQPSAGSGIDVAHPYLHRPLLDFVLSIPLRELCRPGETRSLMRRAFSGLVPSRVLNRTSKGYVGPARARSLRRAADMFPAHRPWLLSELGLIDVASTKRRLQEMLDGSCTQLGNLSLIMGLELWLRRRVEAPARCAAATNSNAYQAVS